MRPNYSSFVFLGFRIYSGTVSDQGRSSTRRSVFLSSASIFDTLLKRPTIFCPILPSIFRHKPLYLVIYPLYFPFKPQFCIIITDSTCGGIEVLYYIAKTFSLHIGEVKFFVIFSSLTPFERKSPFFEQISPFNNPP